MSCVLNTSHGMHSCVQKREDVKKSIVISLGAIDVDIPQHPVALHCMMTRSSKTLSKQLSEIQSQRSVMRYFICDSRNYMSKHECSYSVYFLLHPNIP